jgi:hypothetical protein
VVRLALISLVLVLVACHRDVDRDVDRDNERASATSWRDCAGAIDRWRDADAPPPCAALHVCANEAVLAVAQRRTLDRMIAATPECAPP